LGVPQKDGRRWFFRKPVSTMWFQKISVTLSTWSTRRRNSSIEGNTDLDQGLFL
jgi:hypothetical protein